MKDTLLSLDVGTTAVKAVLFDPEGSEIHTSEQALTLLTPQPGFVELDPQELLQAVTTVLSDTAANAPRSRIRALAIATQGGSFLAVDAHGKPTTQIITWMDSRSLPVVADWKERGLEPVIRGTSGWSLDPGLPLPMIGWLQAYQPDIFSLSARFISVNDYLTHFLAGIYSMNPSMAGEMLLTCISEGSWSPDLCRLVGIHPHQLSPIQPSDAVLGPILPAVASLTGLSPGILVVNGGQDHSCEALAVGMTSPGTALLACGTAWVVNGATASGEMTAVPPGMNLNFHVIPGRWVISQFLGGLGGTLEWWINRLWQSPDPAAPIPRARLYALLNEALAGTQPGSSGLLFFPLAGSNTASPNPGKGGFWGLTWDHNRPDMTRAVMESAAFELRASLERLKSAGLPMEKIWMIGGAARSPLWPSIIASLTGTPVTLTHYSHGPALGAAILAGLGLGIYKDVDTARACFDLKPRQVFPDAAQHTRYEDAYQQYCRLTGKLADMG